MIVKSKDIKKALHLIMQGFYENCKSIFNKLLYTMHKPCWSHTNATHTRHHHNI